MWHLSNDIFCELIGFVGYIISPENIWSDSGIWLNIFFIRNIVDGAHVLNNGW